MSELLEFEPADEKSADSMALGLLSSVLITNRLQDILTMPKQVTKRPHRVLANEMLLFDEDFALSHAIERDPAAVDQPGAFSSGYPRPRGVLPLWDGVVHGGSEIQGVCERDPCIAASGGVCQNHTSSAFRNGYSNESRPFPQLPESAPSASLEQRSRVGSGFGQTACQALRTLDETSIARPKHLDHLGTRLGSPSSSLAPANYLNGRVAPRGGWFVVGVAGMDGIHPIFFCSPPPFMSCSASHLVGGAIRRDRPWGISMREAQASGWAWCRCQCWRGSCRPRNVNASCQGQAHAR